jgi:hypothetical protein
VYKYCLKNLHVVEHSHFSSMFCIDGTTCVINSFHTSRLAFSNFWNLLHFAFFIHHHQLTTVSIIDKRFRATRPFLFLDRFLAHLSWKLKWAILIAGCPSSVRLSVCPSVRPSVCKLFTFSTSSPEPLRQFQPDLAQIILGGRGFKFVQMKGGTLL